MKNKQKFNPFLCSFAVLSALVLATVTAATVLFYYLFSIPEPEGLSLASWPQKFTDNFSVWMEKKDGQVSIDKTGLERLDEYGLWLQVIDESGREIYAYRKPEDYPADYSASELTALNTSAFSHGYTVFVSSLTDADEALSYLVGFPYAVGKYMLYYDSRRISRLMPAAKAIAFSALLVLAVLIFGYVFWLSRKLSGITGGIRDVSLRSFCPLEEKGIFKGIYAALNTMDAQIRQSDRIKEETERTRNEWIANITHDLKTPLSPVKGYAELLAGHEVSDTRTVQEYGQIILKNISHTERLLNDLKLTYQLDSGAAPYHPRKVPVTRYLREIAIDIINDPAFSGRHIEFDSSSEKLTAFLDPGLFRRAIQNLIINALIHNPPDTRVAISVGETKAKAVVISIRDDGTGMGQAESDRLFDRYYRGTSTKEKPEGSGLGLAIAKQVITLHGGKISVQSAPGAGTEFIITLAQENICALHPAGMRL